MAIRQVLCIASVLALTLGVCGCTGGDADKTAGPADSAAAIEKSKEKATAKEQAEYLLAEAKRFITEDAPAEAAKIAEHVMANFEEFKDQATKLLEEAKAKVEEAAKAAAETATEGAEKLKEGLGGAVPTE